MDEDKVIYDNDTETPN